MTISGVGSVANMIRRPAAVLTLSNGSGSERTVAGLTVTRDRIIGIRAPLIRIK